MLHTCCHKLLNIIVVLLQNYSLLWICCNASIKLVVTKNYPNLSCLYTSPFISSQYRVVFDQKSEYLFYIFTKHFWKLQIWLVFNLLNESAVDRNEIWFFCKRELSATFFFIKDQVRSEWWSTCVLLWEYFVGVCFYWFPIMCFRAYSATWMIVWAKMLHSEWISGENCNLEHHQTYQWWQ